MSPGLTWSVHGDLDGSVVSGHLWRVGEYRDCQREALASAAAANEAKVVEARYLVLHHTRGVPQLGGVVLVVARHDGHNSPIGYVSQGNHLEGDRQRLVAPPVGRQDGAQKVGAVGPNQLSRVVCDDLGHAAVLVGAQSRHRS